MFASSVWRSLFAVLVLGACTYNSEYVPPADGRARVVWRDGDPMAMIPRLNPECAAAARATASAVSEASETSPPCSATGAGCGGSVYVGNAPYLEFDAPHPHFWAIHEIHEHAHLPRPHPSSGGPVFTPNPGPVMVPVHAAEPVPGPAGHAALPVGTPRSSGSSSASGLGSLFSGGGKEIGIALVVIALCTMPLVAIALATSDAENPAKSAGAVDLVNAFNDTVRSPGNSCTAPPAQPGPPPSYPPPPSEEAQP